MELLTAQDYSIGQVEGKYSGAKPNQARGNKMNQHSMAVDVQVSLKPKTPRTFEDRVGLLNHVLATVKANMATEINNDFD